MRRPLSSPPFAYVPSSLEQLHPHLQFLHPVLPARYVRSAACEAFQILPLDDEFIQVVALSFMLLCPGPEFLHG